MRYNKGIIQAIVLIIVGTIILWYLNVDVGGLVHDTLAFFQKIWENYLRAPAAQIMQMISGVIRRT